MCCRVGVLADGRDDVPAPRGEPLDAELAETAGSALVKMVRGTLASYAEVASWDTLGSPGPRPNPQKLLVLARDPLIVVARDLKAVGADRVDAALGGCAGGCGRVAARPAVHKP